MVAPENPVCCSKVQAFSTPPHFLLKDMFKGILNKGNIIVGAVRTETKHRNKTQKS